MAILGLRAYSRHRGVTLAAVQKAIKSGRIFREPDGRIDSEQADTAWAQNTWLHATLDSQKREEETASIYTKARIMREVYRARLSQLAYEERAAQLVRTDEFEAAGSETLLHFRSYMLRVPARVAAAVAAESDAARVCEILEDAMRTALNEFADSDFTNGFNSGCAASVGGAGTASLFSDDAI